MIAFCINFKSQSIGLAIAQPCRKAMKSMRVALVKTGSNKARHYLVVAAPEKQKRRNQTTIQKPTNFSTWNYLSKSILINLKKMDLRLLLWSRIDSL